MCVTAIPVRRDALLEFDDLEAAPGLLLLLGGLGDLLRLVVTRFHDGTSFRAVCSAWKASSPGAQTERRGDVGPMLGFLGVKTVSAVVHRGGLLPPWARWGESKGVSTTGHGGGARSSCGDGCSCRCR